MHLDALEAIAQGKIAKGDVLTTARTAGILAAKQSATLIPYSHLVLLSDVAIEFILDDAQRRIVVTATVRSSSSHSITTEALTVVSVAALTIYDMTKRFDRGMTITNIQVVQKRGGHTGD